MLPTEGGIGSPEDGLVAGAKPWQACSAGCSREVEMRSGVERQLGRQRGGEGDKALIFQTDTSRSVIQQQKLLLLVIMQDQMCLPWRERVLMGSLALGHLRDPPPTSQPTLSPSCQRWQREAQSRQRLGGGRGKGQPDS